ncbi:ECF transporter S component [Domibacillus sp. DTU_2020_1001157_1_SI_ALB_TIR_016]|uniref:ECF transporter S component n=1 Tax=Domibacillus sp. DTU_2020_1001157_1_SI_ALB_TIR_016 TaxID=3077789 RepID=UPI0028ED62C2|nr:ECF transporter S component [Domibacillus sp. DTU_2020_1001157_1_SI_ALB_TIR_016]WNS82056.1 ECF transporter S component [Domibacillus sp. DTU_2020_1001157_1_SI_ALB_TIR_016]
MKENNVRLFTAVGLLSALAYLLMLLNFPIPPFPGFLMIDFSDIPALIAAIVFGPIAGITVELLKNVINFIMTGSPTGVPVGHVANFAAGISFILPIAFIYQRFQTKKAMPAAILTGVVSMAVIMSILNYFVILPAYTLFLGSPAMSGPEMRQMITTGILPFNFVKGLVVGTAFYAIFFRLQSWTKKTMAA